MKDPHPPANLEPVADISAKHSVHDRCKAEYIAWRAREQSRSSATSRFASYDGHIVHAAAHQRSA
jgi:hypothetical protein